MNITIIPHKILLKLYTKGLNLSLQRNWYLYVAHQSQIVRPNYRTLKRTQGSLHNGCSLNQGRARNPTFQHKSHSLPPFVVFARSTGFGGRGDILEIIALKEVFSATTALSGKFFLITIVGNGVRNTVIGVWL